MNKKLELLLVKKYPSIFRNYGGDMVKTCMHWGFEHEDGWFMLLYKACKDIQEICNTYNIEFIAEQIKEKFGGLRWYYDIHGNKEYTINKIERHISRIFYKHRLGRQFNALRDFRQKIYITPKEIIYNIVRKAEEESYKTCEICGAPGVLRGRGWMYVSCEEHKGK